MLLDPAPIEKPAGSVQAVLQVIPFSLFVTFVHDFHLRKFPFLPIFPIIHGSGRVSMPIEYGGKRLTICADPV